MANYNLEMYLEELEKQVQSVKAGAEAVFISLNTVRDNAESVIRATNAFSEMVEITRRAMRLKREVRTADNPGNVLEEDWGDHSPPPPPTHTPQATEDWDRELNEELKPYSYQTVRFYSYPTPQKIGSTINYETLSPAVSFYRTTTSYQSWAVCCPACGGRQSRCPCS